MPLLFFMLFLFFNFYIASNFFELKDNDLRVDFEDNKDDKEKKSENEDLKCGFVEFNTSSAKNDLVDRVDNRVFLSQEQNFYNGVKTGNVNEFNSVKRHNKISIPPKAPFKIENKAKYYFDDRFSEPRIKCGLGLAGKNENNVVENVKTEIKIYENNPKQDSKICEFNIKKQSKSIIFYDTKSEDVFKMLQVNKKYTTNTQYINLLKDKNIDSEFPKILKYPEFIKELIEYLHEVIDNFYPCLYVNEHSDIFVFHNDRLYYLYYGEAFDPRVNGRDLKLLELDLFLANKVIKDGIYDIKFKDIKDIDVE